MIKAPTSDPESTAGDLAFHARGFELSLASANKRPNAIKSYLEAVTQLDAFLAVRGMPRDVEGIPSRGVDRLRRRTDSGPSQERLAKECHIGTTQLGLWVADHPREWEYLRARCAGWHSRDFTGINDERTRVTARDVMDRFGCSKVTALAALEETPGTGTDDRFTGPASLLPDRSTNGQYVTDRSPSNPDRDRRTVERSDVETCPGDGTGRSPNLRTPGRATQT